MISMSCGEIAHFPVVVQFPMDYVTLHLLMSMFPRREGASLVPHPALCLSFATQLIIHKRRCN